MKLLVVRHGETDENKNKIVQGTSCGTLSKRGLYQTETLARRLVSERIEVIYSSNLERTASMAKEIAKYHPNTPYVLTENLRGRTYGNYEEQPWPMRRFNNYELGVENFESECERIEKFLEEMDSYAAKVNLAVMRAGSMIALFVNLLNLSTDEIKTNMKKPDNVSLSIFDPFPQLKLYNCTEHLKNVY